jgi:hypothetical protein
MKEKGDGQKERIHVEREVINGPRPPGRTSFLWSIFSSHILADSRGEVPED